MQSARLRGDSASFAAAASAGSAYSIEKKEEVPITGSRSQDQSRGFMLRPPPEEKLGCSVVSETRHPYAVARFC